MVELSALWLPILLTSAVMFFAGFLAWMVLPHHKPDWQGLKNEDEFLQTVGGMNIPEGNYVFPYACDSEAMKSEEHKRRMEQGPVGTLQVWGGAPAMGKNLALQFVFLMVTNTCLAYLATLGLEIDDGFMPVFRFVATAGFLTYTAAAVPGSIWFKLRLPGYLIDGVIHGLIAGAIFGWLWPSGPVL
jgi:hypothetical protein